MQNPIRKMRKFTLLLSVFILIANLSYSQNYSWKQKASIPGLSRYGAFKFVIGSYGYVGGGCDSLGNNLNDLWMYNPLNNTWTQKSSCPIYTRTAGSFAINFKGYVVGGILNSGSITNQLYEYDAITNSWTQKSNYPGSPVYAAASFSLNGKGYYGIGNGGTATGPYHVQFYEYNPVTDSWSQKANFPGISRYGVNSIVSGSYGYVGFGSNETLFAFFNDWYQYNPVTDSWLPKQNYPIAISNPSSFYINNKIYMACGHNFVNAFDLMYSYDEVSNTWVSEPAFPGTGRWAGIGFSINNIGYVGTGWDTTGINTFSDFYEFSPQESHDSIQCVTVRPDSLRGKDAIIYSIMPNTNYNTHQELLCNAWTCQGSPCISRALINFDLSVIPLNATFISATLDLYSHPTPLTMPVANYGTNNSFVIRRVTSPWSEDSVTWNTQPTTTTQNEITIPQSGLPNQNYLNIDVTTLVYDMLNNPQSSYGFMLKLVNEIPYNGRDFASSDYPDSTLWPSITYCYIMPTSVSSVNKNADDIRVFPTLFQNKLNVEYQSNKSVGRLELMDIAGQLKLSLPLKQTPGALTKLMLNESQLCGLNNGMYILRLTDGEKVYVKRVVRSN